METLGGSEGDEVGLGDSVGFLVAIPLLTGGREGTEERVGSMDAVGKLVGVSDGVMLGVEEGISDGAMDGAAEGSADEGSADGSIDKVGTSDL